MNNREIDGVTDTTDMNDGDFIITNKGPIQIKESPRGVEIGDLRTGEPWPWHSVDGKYVFNLNLTSIGYYPSNGVSRAINITPNDGESAIVIFGWRQGVDNNMIRYDLWRSGFVNRYHCHPHPVLRNSHDLTDAHSARMVKLLMILFPEYIETLSVPIIMHDAGEFLSGDSPYKAKVEFPPLKSGVQEVEDYQIDLFYESISLSEFEMNQEQKDILKLLDLLDSLLYQINHIIGHEDSLRDLFQNIMERAKKLDRSTVVRNLVLTALRSNYIDIDRVVN